MYSTVRFDFRLRWNTVFFVFGPIRDLASSSAVAHFAASSALHSRFLGKRLKTTVAEALVNWRAALDIQPLLKHQLIRSGRVMVQYLCQLVAGFFPWRLHPVLQDHATSKEIPTCCVVEVRRNQWRNSSYHCRMDAAELALELPLLFDFGQWS